MSGATARAACALPVAPPAVLRTLRALVRSSASTCATHAVTFFAGLDVEELVRAVRVAVRAEDAGDQELRVREALRRACP